MLFLCILIVSGDLDVYVEFLRGLMSRLSKGCLILQEKDRQRSLSIVNRKFVFTFVMCENATLALAFVV